MSKNFFLFSCEPGGSNCIVPLVNPLKARGFNVSLFGKDMALEKYINAGLPGLNLINFTNSTDIKNIEMFLEKENPDFIITGTSGNDFTERFIWKSAENLGINSFAIIDQWINYGIRFSKYGLSEITAYKNDKTHPYIPTKILLMDKYAKKEAIEDGLPPSRLIITGNPYFENLLDNIEKITIEKIKKLRHTLGIEEHDFLITYASEPVSNDYNSNYWGFTEKTIFREIREVLYETCNELNKKIKLIIRPHPREPVDNHSEFISEYHNISIIVDKSINPYELIMASNLIFGMSSMFLIEAVILNKPVLSIMIGLKRENPFILHRRKIVKSILDKKTLLNQLKSIIIGHEIPKYNFNMIKNPINNIISEMEKYL